MNQEFINIAKKPGIKNCVRINSEKDIPDYLKDVVRIDGDTLILDCLEGEERVPCGSVIAYEKLESGKMNVWNKANYKETTIEANGVFYELPRINKATPVLDGLSEQIMTALGDKINTLEDGSLVLTTDWGKSICAPYNGYLVIYGQKKDGSLDANFLTKGTSSFEQYFVVDEKGEFIEPLYEYDMKLTNERSNRL